MSRTNGFMLIAFPSVMLTGLVGKEAVYLIRKGF